MTSEAFWRFILSLTVAFPAIIGLVRIKNSDRAYRPFLIYAFVSLLNELLWGLVFNHYDKKTQILSWHIFNLFETIILLLQFYYWKQSKKQKKVLLIANVVIVCGWFFENFIFSNIYQFNAVYLITYSFVLVLLSVQTINYIIVNYGKQPLVKNAMFIICSAMIIFFIYNIFVYTLLVKGININNKRLIAQVFEIRVYINAFTNIIYGIGVYFIPQRIANKDLFKEFEDNKF